MSGKRKSRFFYETGARELILDGDDANVGVKAVERKNKLVDLRGRNVILASGDFRVTRKC